MKRNGLMLVTVLFLFSAAMPQSDREQAALPGSETLLRALTEEISGEIARRYTRMISSFDRIQAGQGWHDAAVAVQNELQSMGYQDALIEGWPSTGSTRYYTWRTPIGWRASKAELWMTSPRREKICSYEEVPLTLVKHSGPGNCDAQLVDVESGMSGKDYSGKDLKGKIVLAYGSPAFVMREAVKKRGALGIVIYYPPHVRPGYPSMVRYNALWPRWEERNELGMAFSISKNDGARLKAMLESGETVMVHAEVESEFYETHVECLSASLPGREKRGEELLLVAHLCHPLPSANDNASGSAGLLEMARALKTLVNEGKIPPPKRTIRFLWVPEFAGTIPWIKANLERTRRTLASINCDMIGEDLHLTGGAFYMTRTPDSLPTFFNDLAAWFIDRVDRLNLKSLNGSNHPFVYQVVPYSGGSDHYIFNDGSLGIPALMFGHNDMFHHTSLDTIDKVDASELRRVCTIALAAMAYLAGAGEEEARGLVPLVAGNGMKRCIDDYHRVLAQLNGAVDAETLHEAYYRLRLVIDHSARREADAIRSILKVNGSRAVREEIEVHLPLLENLRFQLTGQSLRIYHNLCKKMKTDLQVSEASADDTNLSKLIPRRNTAFVCPLERDFISEKLGADEAEKMKLRGNVAYEAVNFMDGKRSVLDIYRALTAEFGTQNLQELLEFCRILEKAGLIRM